MKTPTTPKTTHQTKQTQAELCTNIIALIIILFLSLIPAATAYYPMFGGSGFTQSLMQNETFIFIALTSILFALIYVAVRKVFTRGANAHSLPVYNLSAIIVAIGLSLLLSAWLTPRWMNFGFFNFNLFGWGINIKPILWIIGGVIVLILTLSVLFKKKRSKTFKFWVINLILLGLWSLSYWVDVYETFPGLIGTPIEHLIDILRSGIVGIIIITGLIWHTLQYLFPRLRGKKEDDHHHHIEIKDAK